MSLSETIFFFIPFSTTSDVLSLMTVCKDLKEVTRKSIEFFTAIEYQENSVMCGRTFLNTCYCDACGFDSSFLSLLVIRFERKGTEADYYAEALNLIIFSSMPYIGFQNFPT